MEWQLKARKVVEALVLELRTDFYRDAFLAKH
jgi:hypothetical protein